MTAGELSKFDFMRLAGEAHVDPRTVEKAYDGGHVMQAVYDAIHAAALKLELTPPPKEKRR